MTRSRRLPARFGAAFVVGWALVSGARAACAGTAANTVISNTSSATYEDASAQTYGTTSNTVSVVVQNAPALTISAGSGKTVAPGQTVSDTFTIQNTGNANGIVTLTAGSGTGVTGGTYSGSPTVSYAYDATAYANVAALNAALSAVPVPAGASIAVNVVYALPATGGAASGTVVTNLSGTIAYAAAGSAPAQTSSPATATPETDTVMADVRLDVAISTSQDPASGAITYTAGAVDGSSTWGARDSLAVKALLGTTVPGVFISVKIPQFNGSPLTVVGSATATPNATYGFAAGAAATLYYTTSPNGSTGWTATSASVPAGAQFIGAFVSGGTCTINGGAMSGVEFCPLAGPASSAGSVPNPALALSFTVAQPAGNGSANSGAVTTLANSIIGDNAMPEHVVAPGITRSSLTDSLLATAALTTAGAGIDNTTAITSPSGASQLTSNQSLAQYAVKNGPFGSAAASGSFDGSSNDDNHDFTAVSFVSTGDIYTTTDVSPTYSPATATATKTAVSNIKIENTLANTGNKADAYTIVATAPPGWTVQLQADAGNAPAGALGGAAAGQSSTATLVPLASGATLNYWAVYAAPSGVAYLSHATGTVVATSVGDGTIKNSTNHLLYAGFVAITTTAATTPNCPAGVSPTAGTVCPGGTITYTIDYRNIVGGSSNYDRSSAAAVSFAGVMTKPGSLLITADGTSAALKPDGTSLGNNWATYSSGPTAPPVDTTANTVFAFFSGSSAGTPAGTFQTGLTKFTAVVGGAAFQLVPYGVANGTGCQGTITFAVTVN